MTRLHPGTLVAMIYVYAVLTLIMVLMGLFMLLAGGASMGGGMGGNGAFRARSGPRNTATGDLNAGSGGGSGTRVSERKAFGQPKIDAKPVANNSERDKLRTSATELRRETSAARDEQARIRSQKEDRIRRENERLAAEAVEAQAHKERETARRHEEKARYDRDEAIRLLEAERYRDDLI